MADILLIVSMGYLVNVELAHVVYHWHILNIQFVIGLQLTCKYALNSLFYLNLVSMSTIISWTLHYLHTLSIVPASASYTIYTQQ